MASVDEKTELLTCPICQNIFTEPVTLKCRHNFCRDCVSYKLDTQDDPGIYHCPHCRAEFFERPELSRNVTLYDIVENLRSARSAYGKPKIFCAYCIQLPMLAVKSCVMCEASLCDKHLRVHSKSPEHVLIEPTVDLGNRKCFFHRRILEYYCRRDLAFICTSCIVGGQHWGHEVDKLDEASEKKKKELRDVLQELITHREEAEKNVQRLQEQGRQLQKKAVAEKERVAALFRDIRRQLEDLEERVLREVSRQEKQMLLTVSDEIHQLEIKKEKLSRKMGHIEELCNMTDPLTVLQEPETGDLCDTEDDEDRERRDKLLEDGGDLDVPLISQTLHTLSDITGVKRGIYTPQSIDMSPDIDTASNNLYISEDLKTAFWSHAKQRPDSR